VDLVIEVRQVVFVRPLANLLRGTIGMAVVVVAVPIALVKPRLVLMLELVVEDHPLDARAALLEAFCFTFVGVIDLDVVFQFPLAFETRIERLPVLVVMVTVGFQKVPAFLRQHDRVVAVTRHTCGLDEPLLPKVAQVSGARVSQSIIVVSEVTTRDHSERTHGRERQRF
jgi:hypothetical protein